MKNKLYFLSLLLSLATTINAFGFPLNEDILIGSYSTKIEGSENKLHNIQLASYSIDETIIYPDALFSYNNTLGPTTTEAGYKSGKIFIEGKEVDGIGGGVCQVSSTLYNAVLQADLDVIERHPHSKEVQYVPKDKDAATSYGGIDFKFLNNTNRAIRINSFVYENSIYVNLYYIFS